MSKINKKTWLKMMQTWKMAKNLILDGPFAQICTPNFFSWILLLLDVRHCFKLSMYSILINKTQEDGKKPRFGPDLGALGPNSGQNFFI